MSSDMATIILFIAKLDTLPMYIYSNLYSFRYCIAMYSDWNMTAVILTREERGKEIASKPNQILRLGERFYKVTSQNGRGIYDVTKARMKKQSDGHAPALIGLTDK
jgi:hypothetical protein